MRVKFKILKNNYIKRFPFHDKVVYTKKKKLLFLIYQRKSTQLFFCFVHLNSHYTWFLSTESERFLSITCNRYLDTFRFHLCVVTIDVYK